MAKRNNRISFTLHRKSTDVIEDGEESKDRKPYHHQTTKNRYGIPKWILPRLLPSEWYSVCFFIRVTRLQTKDDERGPHALSTTSRKKQESSFVLSSQDVLDAVTLENDQVGMMANRK